MTIRSDEKDWRSFGACREYDADLWFPDSGIGRGGKGPATVKAIAICYGCDVRRKCLNWAIETDQRFGIWGARTAEERRYIQSRRRQQ
ncbi:MAG TPA: WhiB family transcriptional regulator [Jiangellaceae bacterium]